VAHRLLTREAVIARIEATFERHERDTWRCLRNVVLLMVAWVVFALLLLG